jgi:allantoate deiminase
LEDFGKSLGVVTGIVGQSRVSVTITGRAAHAGTTPMGLRRDALVVAARIVGEVNEVAKREAGLVGTVGRMEVGPGASNVVPGNVRLSVDVRHARDEVRRRVVAGLMERAAAIAGAAGCSFDYDVDGDYESVPMDGRMIELLTTACADAGTPAHAMGSGAGHDAAVMAEVVPSGMLFLRSPGGVSHHPEEAVIREDVEMALGAMVGFVGRMATG